MTQEDKLMALFKEGRDLSEEYENFITKRKEWITLFKEYFKENSKVSELLNDPLFVCFDEFDNDLHNEHIQIIYKEIMEVEVNPEEIKKCLKKISLKLLKKETEK